MLGDLLLIFKDEEEPTWVSIEPRDMDIIDIKEAVRAGAISFYVKESVIYCTNKIGEVVKVGIVDETGNNNH